MQCRRDASEHCLPGIGEDNAVVEAGEQRLAEKLFQLAHQLAHGGRGYGKFFGGQRKAAAAGGGLKGLQGIEWGKGAAHGHALDYLWQGNIFSLEAKEFPAQKRGFTGKGNPHARYS